MPFPLPPPDTRIETPRLTLRPYRPGDGAWYCEMSLRNQSHLQRYEAGNAVMRIHTVEEAEAAVREFAADWRDGRAFFLGAFRTTAAFDKHSAVFVAQIYIGVVQRDLPEFEVGFFVDVAHEGQGYVSEAVRGVLPFLFDALGARRIRLECDDANVRSARVAERCGFVREGHIRENHLWPDGTVTGTFHYGLLHSELASKDAY